MLVLLAINIYRVTGCLMGWDVTDAFFGNHFCFVSRTVGLGTD